MTTCKVLAQGKNRNDDVIVYQKWEKYDSSPYYEIVIANGGLAYLCERTERTTWKKRFKQLTEE